MWKGLKEDREHCTCYHIYENPHTHNSTDIWKNCSFIYSIALSLRVRLSIDWHSISRASATFRFVRFVVSSFRLPRTNCLYLIKCISVYCTAHSLSLSLSLWLCVFFFLISTAISWFQCWVLLRTLFLSSSFSAYLFPFSSVHSHRYSWCDSVQCLASLFATEGAFAILSQFKTGSTEVNIWTTQNQKQYRKKTRKESNKITLFHSATLRSAPFVRQIDKRRKNNAHIKFWLFDFSLSLVWVQAERISSERVHRNGITREQIGNIFRRRTVEHFTDFMPLNNFD